MQMSTMLGWYDPTLNDRSKRAKKITEPATFQMLVKCENDPNRVANHISRLINQYLSEKGKLAIIQNRLSLAEQQSNQRQGKGTLSWFERPYYWDLMIVFKTRKISRMIRLMADKIRELEGVTHTTTMPFLAAGLDENVDFSQFSETHYFQGKLYKPAKPASVSDSYCSVDDEKLKITNHLNDWKQGIDLFPKSLSALAEDDALVNRYIHVNRELHILYAYSIQLEESWQAQVRLRTHEGSNARQNLLSRKTFKDFRATIKKYFQAFAELETNYRDAFSRANREQLSTNEKKTLVNLFQQKWWLYLEMAKFHCYRIKELLLGIAAEFHNRTESHQVISLTEHALKVGEQAGVLDLTMEAIGRLFRRYCGEANPYILKTGKWATDQSSNTPEDQRDDLGWKGLFISSIGSDYKIFPQAHLLYLPMDLRFATRGKLLIVAHEAAHQILYNISLNNISTHPAGVLPGETVFYGFQKWWNDFRDAVKKHADKQADLAEFSTNLILGKYSLHEIEVLADIFGLLAAGPGFIREMIHYLGLPLKEELWFLKNREYMESNTTEIRIVSLRIAIMYTVAKKLGWLDKDLDDFQIEHLINDYFSKHETKAISDVLFKNAKIDTDPSLAELYHTLPDQDSIWSDLLILRFLQTEDGENAIKSLVQWIHLHGSKFHFYPLPFEENLQPTAEQWKNAWEKKYPAIIAYINEYCSLLNDRFVYNDEIILDAPLRYIAGASAMNNTPGHYSMGRILHSLYYSDWLTSYNNLIEEMRKLVDFVS